MLGDGSLVEEDTERKTRTALAVVIQPILSFIPEEGGEIFFILPGLLHLAGNRLQGGLLPGPVARDTAADS